MRCIHWICELTSWFVIIPLLSLQLLSLDNGFGGQNYRMANVDYFAIPRIFTQGGVNSYSFPKLFCQPMFFFFNLQSYQQITFLVFCGLAIPTTLTSAFLSPLYLAIRAVFFCSHINIGLLPNLSLSPSLNQSLCLSLSLCVCV